MALSTEYETCKFDIEGKPTILECRITRNVRGDHIDWAQPLPGSVPERASPNKRYDYVDASGEVRMAELKFGVWLTPF